ncbi:MAG TPA: adenylate/guanylate cyclase domain-containing protein [Methylomirabilota bacterium]|nr:adenylate/guanylate cyclase domain-containing protein [Methylomirabilota bacterium]
MRLRIRPTLMVAAACLVVVATAAVAVAVNNVGSRIVEDLVDRRFKTIAESAAAEVADLIGGATSVLREQCAMAAQGLLPLDDSAALGRRFAERLRQQPQFAWISYGDGERDRFVGATRRADVIVVNRSERAVDGGQPSEAVAQADGSWTPVTGQQRAPYSVVTQRWFAAALATDAIVVTGPYTFAEGLTGLTLSSRWVDADNRPRGVFTVDFFLRDLSRKLAALAGDSSDAFLLDADGQLLVSAGAVNRLAVAESVQTAVAAHRDAILALVPGRSLAVDIASPAGDLRASLTSIEAGLGVKWVFVVLEPEATLFAPLRRLHLAILVASAAVVLVGLVAAVLLAGRLAGPLDALSAEAERIRNFDLDGPVEAHSGIVELANLIDAVGAMKAGLRSFGHFVPKRVVKRLIAAGGTATLGGGRRELTIMFSDIAGFTHTSEAMPPEQVMPLISHYFDVMSDAIHENQGIVDKFIGDAVMAIWNAPRRDPDHVANACRALLACMRANDALDREAAAAGGPPLPTRYGLHTGDAVIGNIGSTDRMQYTALGATVNLASRLESLNKRYGTRNLVSAVTRDRAGEAFLFRTVAVVMPAGTTRPVEVFELLGAADDADAASLRDRIQRWEAAISALRRGRAAEALTLFEAIAAERPPGGLAAFYVARSAEVARRSPGNPWDGVDDFSKT